MSAPHSCRRCRQSFQSRKALAQHLRDRHKGYYYSVRVVPVLLILVAAGVSWAAYGPAMYPTQDGESSQESVWRKVLLVVTKEGLSGEQFRLISLRGRPLMLEFMVSWCPSCQRMAPILEELYSDYGTKVGFVSIAGTWRGADAKSTAEFIRVFGGSWLHLLDTDNKFFEAFGVDATPTYFFIDSKGRVAATFQGETPKDALVSQLKKLQE